MSEVTRSAGSLPNSARHPMANAVRRGAQDADAPMSVTLLLRRRPGSEPVPALARRLERPRPLTREAFAASHGADQADLDAVAAFAAAHGLTVVETSLGGRRVVLAGSVRDMEAAFNVTFGAYQAADVSYRGFEGAARLPATLGAVVEHVVGLDNRPVGRPMVRGELAPQETPADTGPRPTPADAGPFLPADVATLYDFPAISAKGQTIGILEFGGGYLDSDLANFFTNYAKVTAPTVISISVDNAVNTPPAVGVGDKSGLEMALDIELAGAIAPEATIAVYFAPNNEQGWVDAFSTALHGTTYKPSVLSISWGGGESGLSGWESSLDAVLADAQSLGVTILFSSGDGGAGSPADVSYPASAPYVTGCGGTTISNVSGISFTETAWSGSGGGVSNSYPVPGWQNKISIPSSLNPAGHVGRGVPDIAGNSDSASPYTIIEGGQVWNAFGTSAVPPLYAGLIARLNAGNGEPAGFLNADLYEWAAAGHGPFSDVTSGNNDTGGAGYSAGAGWDAVTGLGSLKGTALFNLLGGYCALQQSNLQAAQEDLDDAPDPGEIPGLTPVEYRALLMRLRRAVEAAEKALAACQAAHGEAAQPEVAPAAE